MTCMPSRCVGLPSSPTLQVVADPTRGYHLVPRLVRPVNLPLIMPVFTRTCHRRYRRYRCRPCSPVKHYQAPARSDCC